MKPNYYATIPADVRYNEKLTANSKLLYGEITALSSKKGICWAQNKYFAELYNVDAKTISRWIKQLQEEGFISIRMQYNKETKQIEKREIKITPGGGDKNVRRWGQKDPQGGDKNVQDIIYNIYNNNNTSNNNKRASFSRVSDFDEKYITAYKHLVELFDDRSKPKTTDSKVKWLNVIRLCDQKDDVNPRQLYWICKKALADSFWCKNFLSLGIIREKKNGITKLNRFIKQFGGKEFEILANED